MATLVKKSLTLLRAPRNQLAFAVRSRLRWSRGQVTLDDEAKDDLFGWLSGAERTRAVVREQELRQRYQLEELHAHSTALHYCENIAMLESLEGMCRGLGLPVSVDGAVRAVDIGCGAFQYATALHRFLRHHGADSAREVVLRGIEIDGHGVYRDGHTRLDHARAHARLASASAHAQVGDFTSVPLPEQDVLTMWYPFVSRYALLEWGLPLSTFRPRQLFDRACSVLRPGGMLLMANQTAREFAEVRRLCRDLPLECVVERGIATDLVPYAERTADRVGSVWRRIGR
jgi:SAM-dependent methyltransferase